MLAGLAELAERADDALSLCPACNPVVRVTVGLGVDFRLSVAMCDDEWKLQFTLPVGRILCGKCVRFRRIIKIPGKDGARCRFRTCDPYRVKVMLYH